MTDCFDMSDFGSRLSQHRKDLLLVRALLAQRCGISERTQEGYESGRLKPNRQYLLALADAGLDVRYLTTGEYSPKPREGMNEGELTFLLNYQHSDPEVKTQVTLALMIAAAPMHAWLAREQDRMRREQSRGAANDD